MGGVLIHINTQFYDLLGSTSSNLENVPPQPTFCHPVLLRLEVAGHPLGKPGSTLNDLRHLGRKRELGSGLGSFAFPASLGAREAPGKRCHPSRSQGEPGSSLISIDQVSSPGSRRLSFSGGSFAGTGGQRRWK